MARRQLRPRKRTRENPRLKVDNPGRGLNIQVSDNLIDNREASDLQNIAFVEAGSVSKRPGYLQLGNSLSNNPRGTGSYTDSSSSKYICTVDGTALKYIKDSGTTWTSATGDTFTADQVTTFTQADAKLFVWNGTDGGAYFTGAAVTRPGTMPKAKFAIFYKGFHIASGVDGQVNRVYIAEGADVTDFTNASGATELQNSTEVPGATSFTDTASPDPAQFIDIDKNDGDKITGLATFQDSVVIFKERSIHQMTFDATGTPSIALVTKALGCVSHKSIENAENDVFFLSRKGVFILGNEPNFFSSIRTNELSARVGPKMDLISEANFNLASAVYHDYKYWLSVPEGGTTTNNVLWTYDRRYLAWSRSKTSSFPAESFAVIIDSNNREKLVFASSSSAKVFELTQAYNDDGSAIDAYWLSKAYDADEFDIEKRWLYVDLQFRRISGSVDLTLYTDNNTLAGSASISAPDSTGELGNLLIGYELLGGDPADQSFSGGSSAGNNVAYRVPIRKNSRTIKVKVANSSTNQNFVLSALAFGYIPFSQHKFAAANKLSVT